MKKALRFVDNGYDIDEEHDITAECRHYKEAERKAAELI